MILDASGRELPRTIGFTGGLRAVAKKEPRAYSIAYQTVELDRIHTPLANDRPPVEGEL